LKGFFAALVLLASVGLVPLPTARIAAPRLMQSADRVREPALAGRIRLTPAQVRDAVVHGYLPRPVSTILDIHARLRYGEFRWNDLRVPAGPIWMSVDLQRQLLSVFRGQNEIGTAVILYGANSYRTPLGTFAILAKLKNHRSLTYGGAPMPYTLRLTPDGVSIHGSNVRDGLATHGCIGVPAAFAAKLFDAAAVGDQVIIFDQRYEPMAAPARLDPREATRQ